jgi:hypothetical protein
VSIPSSTPGISSLSLSLSIAGHLSSLLSKSKAHQHHSLSIVPSNLMHNNPNRRQHVPALARPAHAGEGTAGALAGVLDCCALLKEESNVSDDFAVREGN